jgi:peptidyl-prolyl cis-trans isomerase D
MLDSFRRLSKSKVGTGILVIFFVAILASFAMGDVGSLKGSNFGLGSSTLAKTGDEEVTDRDVTEAMDRALARLREQNPAATYADLASSFTPLVDSLIQARALSAFAGDHGFVLSTRLVGAGIAQIPQTRGLDGKFSDTAYRQFLGQQRLTDEGLRRILGQQIVQQIMLAPAAANARLAVGLAAPYASMLLEERQGELAVIPVGAFTAGLTPSDAQLAAYYAANKARYTVPEQRSLRIARFGPAQLAAVAPSDQEIATYYNAHQADFGASETRVISQAVATDATTAAGIAMRAKNGPFAAAAQPAGFSAADVSVGPQTRAQFSELAGEKVTSAVFAAGVKPGTIIGPIKSDLGYHVVRVESVTAAAGKTLAAARALIAAKLTVDKRKNALGDLVNHIQDGIDEGQSFADVAARNKLAVVETPLVTAQGKLLADPKFVFPPDLGGALKSGFELTPDDKPVVETLPGDAGFALVSLGKVLPSVPAPLTEIRARVAAAWVTQQGLVRAKAAATAIAAKVAAGQPLAQAIAAAGVKLPPPTPIHARRAQLEQAPPALLPPLKMLFSLAEGTSRMVGMPAANAYAVVRAVKIIPGNALTQPALIAQVQGQFQRGASDELAQQFLAAAQASVGVKRNEAAIAATRQRLTTPAGAAQ